QRSRVRGPATAVPKLHTVVTDTTDGRNTSGNIPTAVPMSHAAVASYVVCKSQF
ncbi:hypothetical protein A2U01_0045692, partial [Trifolium medium]|nr:hypothetical protein [Trifolium medium]